MQHASWGRRIGALFIDWIASTLVVIALFGLDAYSGKQGAPLVLGVFWVETSVGVASARASFGQMLLRIRVLDRDGQPLSLLRAMFRQLLVCLVIPPLVFRPDGRGLHDIWSNSGTWQV